MYKDFLKSKTWKIDKENLYSKFNIHRCFLCGRKHALLEVHHTKYRDKNGKSLLYEHNLNILVALCDGCHELVHEYFGKTPHKKKHLNIIKKEFLAANGYNLHKAFQAYMLTHPFKNTQFNANVIGSPEYEMQREKMLLRRMGTFAYYKSKHPKL